MQRIFAHVADRFIGPEPHPCRSNWAPGEHLPSPRPVVALYAPFRIRFLALPFEPLFSFFYVFRITVSFASNGLLPSIAVGTGRTHAFRRLTSVVPFFGDLLPLTVANSTFVLNSKSLFARQRVWLDPLLRVELVFRFSLQEGSWRCIIVFAHLLFDSFGVAAA